MITSMRSEVLKIINKINKKRKENDDNRKSQIILVDHFDVVCCMTNRLTKEVNCVSYANCYILQKHQHFIVNSSLFSP